MSTAAVTPDTSTTLDVRQETTNYAVIRYPAKEAGKPPIDKMVDAESTEAKAIKGFNEKGEAVPYTGDGQIMFEQEVIFPLAGSLAGVHQIITDETTLYQMVNASLKTRAATASRKELLATNDAGDLTFEVTAEPFDLTELVTSPFKRTKKSDLDKALASIQGLDPADVAKLMALLSQANSQEESE